MFESKFDPLLPQFHLDDEDQGDDPEPSKPKSKSDRHS